jgi:hypothetical protein
MSGVCKPLELLADIGAVSPSLQPLGSPIEPIFSGHSGALQPPFSDLQRPASGTPNGHPQEAEGATQGWPKGLPVRPRNSPHSQGICRAGPSGVAGLPRPWPAAGSL